jgi:hypothetical protein
MTHKSIYTIPVASRNVASKCKIKALLKTNGVVLEDSVQRFSLVHATKSDLFVVVAPKIFVVRPNLQEELENSQNSECLAKPTGTHKVISPKHKKSTFCANQSFGLFRC